MLSYRTKMMIANLGMAMALKVVTFVFGMISSRLLLLIYGSELNGLVASINQFISYINLVELGLTGTAVYALYEPIAKHDIFSINNILTATKQYYFKSGYVFVTLVFLLSCIYPLVTTVSSLNFIEVAYLVIVLGSAGIINFFISAKYRIFLIADQRQYVISILSIIAVILNTGIIYVFGYLLGVNILVLKTICILTSLTPALIIIVYTRIKYKDINFDQVKRSTYKLKNRLTLFINEIAGNIHFGSPIIILTFIVSLCEVSVYSVYNVICNGISSILNAIIVPIASSFGSMLAGNETKSFAKVYKEFEGPFYMISAMLFAITYFVLLPFMRVYTNSITDAEYIRPVFALLMISNMFICNLYNPHAILVRSTGMFKEVQKQTILQAVITIVVGVVLTWCIGICGIVIASIIANLYRSISMMVLYHHRIEGVDSWVTVKNILFSSLNFIAIIGVCRLLELLVGYVYSGDSFFEWGIYSVIVSFISLLVTLLLLFVFMKEPTQMLLSRIKKQKY